MKNLAKCRTSFIIIFCSTISGERRIFKSILFPSKIPALIYQPKPSSDLLANFLKIKYLLGRNSPTCLPAITLHSITSPKDLRGDEHFHGGIINLPTQEPSLIPCLPLIFNFSILSPRKAQLRSYTKIGVRGQRKAGKPMRNFFEDQLLIREYVTHHISLNYISIIKYFH